MIGMTEEEAEALKKTRRSVKQKIINRQSRISILHREIIDLIKDMDEIDRALARHKGGEMK